MFFIKLYTVFMEDSVFTKIIKGEIPASKVYEDDKILAFLDINPLTPGHTLVIPKVQVSHFDELDDDTYQALFEVVKKVAVRIKQVLEPNRVCVRIEGFEVPHTHVHLYPCNSSQDFYGDSDRLSKEPDFPALAEMAAKLAF